MADTFLAAIDVGTNAVRLEILELWDVGHEAALFRRVFHRGLRWEVAPA